MKKIISVFLIFVFILTMLSLVSCGGEQNADKPTENKSNQDLNPDEGSEPGDELGEETTENDIFNMKMRENTKDGLPEINFGGEVFTILQRTEWNYEFLAESESGDVVNDAVYKRNLTVEERFNVKLNPIDVMGGWNEQDIYLKKVRNSVSAGDDEFQLLAGYAAYMPKLQTGGYLINLHELPHVDFDKAWWSTDLKDNFTINGKMYFATGDISLSLWEDILAVYFNKQMIADYQIETPYELVRSGKWTLDKLNEICKNVYIDVDGDGKPSEKADIFGYATDTTNFVDGLFGAFDSPVIKKDENGVPYHAQNTEKMVEIVDKVYEFLWENPGVYANPESSPGPVNLYRYIFEEDRAMFLPELLGNAQALRGMDTDFGIVPYPKWNEQQENYLTTSVAYFSMFCVPTTVQNIEMAGIITEALCAESYKKVIPAFYEVALKSKYSRDDESAEMIDIIRSGLTFDFGKIYVTELAYSMNILRDLMSNKKHEFVSTFEKAEKSYNKALDKLLATFE
ncbi:MAG: hypothetical protein FWF92_10350 [Oscillospiraceae bacterium]|nr:hypothetical protein [Oscillospiraceae bacterium]